MVKRGELKLFFSNCIMNEVHARAEKVATGCWFLIDSESNFKNGFVSKKRM